MLNTPLCPAVPVVVMSEPTTSQVGGLVHQPQPEPKKRRQAKRREESLGRGFGSAGPDQAERGEKGRKRRGSGYGLSDRMPLGKHPDLDAIAARQLLSLPRSGRLRPLDVNRAWKLAAADHHPDRGGELERMQALNNARDLLLGRTPN
jgi:hypothetical protein